MKGRDRLQRRIRRRLSRCRSGSGFGSGRRVMGAGREQHTEKDQALRLQLGRSFFPLLAALAACGSSGTAAGQVRPGIEVIVTDSIHLVRGRRLGILTNQTGVDRAGRSDIDVLRAAGLRLTAIFAPEHGFRGQLDQENIGNTLDSATGVPVYSLYGTNRAPTSQMLDSVDVLLIDLQDIGGRPYTYVSTVLLACKAAKAHGREVLILDRPDPIDGEQVQGPILDSAFSSFVGMLPVPLRHGLTLGELTRLGNDRLGIGADVVVIPAAGWRRSQWFDQTGLPWVRPSPNMPSLESATHYPGLVLLERVNVSVGRGTPIAFQVIGAPWLDPRRVREVMGTVPGVAVTDTTITPVAPGDGRYPALTLPALRLKVTDRNTYDPTRFVVRLLAALRTVHRDSLVFQDRGFDERAGTDRVRLLIQNGAAGDSVWGDWQKALNAFSEARKPYLLYGR